MNAEVIGVDLSKRAKLKLTAWRLYVLGLPAIEIAEKLNCSSRAVENWTIDNDWKTKREELYLDRDFRLGRAALKEQSRIKGEERAYALDLMAMASRAIACFDPATCKPEAIVKMLELSSKLSRLSVGLALTSVEVTVQHNLDEEFNAMIDKVYAAKGLPATAPIEIEGKPNVGLGQDAPG